MSTINEINQAIAAHGKWKAQLQNAIDTGQSDTNPENVKVDNLCKFGKWLHTGIKQEDKNSPHYSNVLKVHADFHKEAGDILQLALSGDKEEASKRIAFGSQFSTLSANLTSAMKRWRDFLQN